MIKALLARYRTWRGDTLPTSGAVPPSPQKPISRPDIAQNTERGFWGQKKVVLRIYQADPNVWYATKVGGYVPYCGTWPEGYRSREDAGFLNIVKFEDAKIFHLNDEDELDICLNCSGSGEGRHEGTTCYVCKGTGEV